jgi:hypothetical protein
MADITRSAVVASSAVGLVDTIGAVIIPVSGEGFKGSNVHFESNAAGGQLPARLQIQESLNSGGLFTAIWETELLAAGQVNVDSARMLSGSPLNSRQPQGATSLQYRVQVTHAAAAARFAATVVGRTEK